MVFGVCLRVTGNAHDAEDATQATFLNLAVQLKCGKDRPPPRPLAPAGSPAVPRSTSAAGRKRRETHEQRHGESRMYEAESLLRDQGRNGQAVLGARAKGAGVNGAAVGSGEIDLEKLNAVLVEELGRLPPKYRLPLMSLYFGQMERDEIARELGLTVGTLGRADSSRPADARPAPRRARRRAGGATA
jgi:DNA-directed RNA polymerase specialized sigma24 family protein